jgi:hypothetical protein
MNGEGERLWKEALTVYFKVVFQPVLEECEENHGIPQNSWQFGRDSKGIFSEYKPRKLSLHQNAPF